MAIYEYQCEEHGRFESSAPIGSAAGAIGCPACGKDSRRVVSAPMLKIGTRGALMSAISHAEKSRHEPEVVTRLPPATIGRRRTLSMTPALRGLPRP